VTIWLNESISMQFRIIDGLSIRFAQRDVRNDHALLLSPWHRGRAVDSIRRVLVTIRSEKSFFQVTRAVELAALVDIKVGGIRDAHRPRGAGGPCRGGLLYLAAVPISGHDQEHRQGQSDDRLGSGQG